MRLTASGWLILCFLSPLVARCEESTEFEVDAVVINLIDEVKVPAQEAGPLAEIVTREGRRVKAGELLVRIDDQDAVLDVSRAQLVLEHALEQADNDDAFSAIPFIPKPALRVVGSYLH